MNQGRILSIDFRICLETAEINIAIYGNQRICIIKSANKSIDSVNVAFFECLIVST